MSQSRRRKAPVVVLLAAVVIVIAAVAAWSLAPRLTGRASDAAAPPSGQVGETPEAVQSGSPVPAATAGSTPAPYTIKPEPTHVATDPARTTLPGGRADVHLTYVTFDASSGTVQASGFVAGLIEDGGTCTLTLTKGTDLVTATSTAGADATTTSCGLLETSPGIAAGNWQAVVAYSSPRASGRSQVAEVAVG